MTDTTIRRGTGWDTVGEILDRFADTTPDAPFLVFEAAPGRIETTTWAGQRDRAVAAGATLQAAGVRAGDRFVVHLRNRPEFFDAWFGAALIGATIVPTNPLLTAEELAYIIGDSGAQLVVTEDELWETAITAAEGVRPSAAPRVILVGGEWESAAVTRVQVAPTDSLSVLYTSGTTSRPKGVLVTHAAYLHAGESVAGHLRLRPDDRQLIVLPLFHGNAQYYSTMSAMVTGASLALTPRFSASRWAEQAERLGATVASLFAAPIRMILAQQPTPSDRAHALRAVLFAQSVSREQAVSFEERFGVPLLQLYGMTETVAPATINPLYGVRHHMSIGRPLPGQALRILRPDGMDAAPGESGELLVGGIPGLTIMSAYLGNDEATRATLQDGFIRTGDTVRLDADGHLSFVDRQKDMIKRAGENVASVEVERALAEHPSVFEAAVIGAPDDMRDEAIVAFVVLAEGVEANSATRDAILADCTTRLAPFKVPSVIEFIQELPRTPVGKIQKHRLRLSQHIPLPSAQPTSKEGTVRKTVDSQ